ncbi:TfuA-like protein [Streptomyces sp. NPDC049906]|uniref:TfuA-like protein n=1 Tax=Streptomyces sp. NPDC049906 TaxID=3155656 RepID=UPI0034229A32
MIHVFTGPTLPASDPQLTAPGIRSRPPARHGDLFDSTIRPGDTAVIIDGLYHQAPALRHKEILAAMARGVHVIGAASIGALRAAELAPYGMLGIGSVYTSYARGEIHGDDEVAVGQAPDGDQDALTWPVVNLRQVLRLARAAGVLDEGRAAGLLSELRTVYYPQRTTAALRAVCRRRNETAFARWLTGQRQRDPHFGDVKRADALAALRTALGHRPPAQTTDQAPAWDTTYYRRWSNAFAHSHVGGLDLLTEDRLVYQQVFDPAFPARWTAYLEHRSRRTGTDGTPGLPLAARLARATGSDLPAHRVFRPPVDLRDRTTLALLLADESEQDRHAVARYAAVLARARDSRPGFQTAAVRDDLTRSLLQHLWQCTGQQLDTEASARGLTCAARAVRKAKRLVPGLLDETNNPTRRPEDHDTP